MTAPQAGASEPSKEARQIVGTYGSCFDSQPRDSKHAHAIDALVARKVAEALRQASAPPDGEAQK